MDLPGQRVARAALRLAVGADTRAWNFAKASATVRPRHRLAVSGCVLKGPLTDGTALGPALTC